MKPFVPSGYTPLCQAVDEVGQMLSKKRGLAWIAKLRTRFLPSVKSDAWWSNKCFVPPENRISAASANDVQDLLMPYRVSEAELEMAQIVNEKTAVARLKAAGLIGAHSIDDWRTWLSGPSPEHRHLYEDPTDPGGTYDERASYLAECRAVKRRREKRDEMAAAATAALRTKPLSPDVASGIKEQVEQESDAYQSIKLRDEVEDGCRQSLYSSRAQAFLLTADGEIFPVAHSYWAAGEGAQAITSTEDAERHVRMETPSGYTGRSGRIMVKQSDFAPAVLQVFGGAVPTGKTTGKSLDDVYRETKDYLVELMKKPKEKGDKKADVKKHCVTTFGVQSLAFNRAWNEAVGHSDTHDWSKPGAAKAGNSEPPITNTPNE